MANLTFAIVPDNFAAGDASLLRFRVCLQLPNDPAFVLSDDQRPSALLAALGALRFVVQPDKGAPVVLPLALQLPTIDVAKSDAFYDTLRAPPSPAPAAPRPAAPAAKPIAPTAIDYDPAGLARALHDLYAKSDAARVLLAAVLDQLAADVGIDELVAGPLELGAGFRRHFQNAMGASASLPIMISRLSQGLRERSPSAVVTARRVLARYRDVQAAGGAFNFTPSVDPAALETAVSTIDAAAADKAQLPEIPGADDFDFWFGPYRKATRSKAAPGPLDAIERLVTEMRSRFWPLDKAPTARQASPPTQRQMWAVASLPSLSDALVWTVEAHAKRADVFPTVKARQYAAFGVDLNAGQTLAGQPFKGQYAAAVLATQHPDTTAYAAPYFGPCPKVEYDTGNTSDPVILDGLVNMARQVVPSDAAAGQNAKTPRFRLDMMDVEAMTGVLSQDAANTSADLDRISATALALLETPEAAPKAASAVITYAEDLLVGYRMDAAIAKPGAAQHGIEKSRWRSLMRRATTIDAEPIPVLVADDARNESYLQPAASLTPGSLTKVRQLARWMGPSLGVPAPSDYPPAANDLPIDITYSYPPGPDVHSLPPLREGRRYLVGLRCVFPGMSGRSLVDTASVYETHQEFSLGDEEGEAFLAERLANIGAPWLALTAGDPVVTAKTVAELNGEALDQAVIRAPADTRTRLLFPPRISIAEGEFLGLFDSDTSARTPAGAFAKAYEMNPDNGDFPGALGAGKIDYPPLKQPDPPVVARGPVARAGAASKTRPYYADPWARLCRATWKYLGLPRDLPPISFWQGSAWTAARPIVIDLAGRASGRAVPDITAIEGSAAASSQIVVRLAPGNQVTLTLTSCADPSQAKRHGRIAALKAQLPVTAASATSKAAGLDGLASALATRLSQINAERSDAYNTQIGMRAASNEPILRKALAVRASVDPAALDDVALLMRIASDQRTLDLVYPVRQPLAPPKPQISTIQAVSISGRDSSAWQEWVDRHNSLDLPSQAGGATTFFAGLIGLHRETTRSLRCLATWKDFSEHSVVKGAAGYELDPAEGDGTLFEYDKIDLPSWKRKPDAVGKPTASDTLDLLYVDGQPGVVAGKSFEFRDTRARRLTCRLAAASRFDQYFPAAASSDPKLSAFEVASKEFEVWTTSTRRPASLSVGSARPYFSYERHYDTTRRTYRVTRTAGAKLVFRNGWHNSGEGEQVGAIFAPLVSDASEVEQPLFSLASKWGGDPTHVSAPILNHLAPANIPGLAPVLAKDGKPRLFRMPLDSDGAASVGVHLAAADPTLDPDTGLWYIDLDFTYRDAAGQTKPENHYWPFVRLGLVRFQRHSVAGLELSTPFVQTIKPPPWRHVSVHVQNGRKKITVKISGPGLGEPTTDHSKRTRMTAKIVRVFGKGELNNDPVSRDWQEAPSATDPNASAQIILKPDSSLSPDPECPDDGPGVLTCQGVLEPRPAFISGTPIAVLIEEHEEFDPDPISAAGVAPAASPTAARLVYSTFIYLGDEAHSGSSEDIE